MDPLARKIWRGKGERVEEGMGVGESEEGEGEGIGNGSGSGRE